ncbi:MAG TPA: hypothetical protein DCR40_10765 [Prolixibacteraceae bacterium]|nr:hypothetical protein [Prolixibacteraceae bacterium]
METSAVLVAGVTGLLGNEICRKLSTKNLHVKAMVSSTSNRIKIDQLTKLGVPFVQGNLQNEGSLRQALQSQLDGASYSMQKSFPGLMLCVANGDRIDMENVLSKFPVKLMSVKDFANSMAKAQLSIA